MKAVGTRHDSGQKWSKRLPGWYKRWLYCGLKHALKFISPMTLRSSDFSWFCSVMSSLNCFNPNHSKSEMSDSGSQNSKFRDVCSKALKFLATVKAVTCCQPSTKMRQVCLSSKNNHVRLCRWLRQNLQNSITSRFEFLKVTALSQSSTNSCNILSIWHLPMTRNYMEIKSSAGAEWCGVSHPWFL